MRKVTFFGMLAFFIGMVFNANAQTFFSEDFEHGGDFPEGWSLDPASGSAGAWAIDDGTTSGPGLAHSGSYTAMFDDSQMYNTKGKMITPAIDLSSTAAGDSIVLSYWYWDGDGNDKVEVYVSTDSTNFDPVDTTETTVSPWTKQFVDLSAYAGDTIYISFNGSSTGGSTNPNVDDIRVKKITADDLAATAVYFPISHCGMTTDTIRMLIANVGSAVQDNYSATYSIDGGATWITPENITTTLNPDDTLLYTFTTLADFSTPGTYNIMAAVVLSGDEDNSNDTITGGSVFSIPIISSYPYTQDFEGAQYWSSGGTNSSWDLGAPAGAVINSAASGSNAWVTNLTGNYNSDENSYVESPCFDFSSLHNPLVQFNYWVDSKDSTDMMGNHLVDGARLDYSLDSGNTWNTVGSLNDWLNWYNMSVSGLNSDGWGGSASDGEGSNGWVMAKHLLPSLAGQSSVKFRVVFGSDGSDETDGFAFDDFTIREGEIKLAITEINYNGPEDGSDTTEFIEWYNYGQDAVNVNGYYYTQGVIDTLPNLLVLPDSFFVSAKDSTLMVNFFGYTGAIEWDAQGLANGGEDIALHTAWGASVDSVFYDDNNGWPTQADGHGPSLVFCEQNIGLNPNDPTNWTVSTMFVDTLNGKDAYASPGALDSACFTWDVAVADPQTGDTIADCSFTATDTVMIELVNEGNQQILAGDTIFGWYQLDSNSVVADTMVLNEDFNPGDTVEFVFDQTVDLSALGYYSGGVWFNYFNDVKNMNDTAYITLYHYEAVVDLGPDMCTSQPDTVVLDAGAGFETYLWQDGSTEQTLHVTEYDTYYVQVTDSNGCEATDTIDVDNCTGIGASALSGTAIYPNPNNGQFVIDLPNNTEKVKIEILTISGQVVYSTETVNAHNVINLTKFDEGIYFVKLSNKDMIANYKVVIQ